MNYVEQFSLFINLENNFCTKIYSSPRNMISRLPAKISINNILIYHNPDDIFFLFLTLVYFLLSITTGLLYWNYFAPELSCLFIYFHAYLEMIPRGLDVLNVDYSRIISDIEHHYSVSRVWGRHIDKPGIRDFQQNTKPILFHNTF
jgi:hypothetical protein